MFFVVVLGLVWPGASSSPALQPEQVARCSLLARSEKMRKYLQAGRLLVEMREDLMLSHTTVLLFCLMEMAVEGSNVEDTLGCRAT